MFVENWHIFSSKTPYLALGTAHLSGFLVVDVSFSCWSLYETCLIVLFVIVGVFRRVDVQIIFFVH